MIQKGKYSVFKSYYCNVNTVKESDFKKSHFLYCQMLMLFTFLTVLIIKLNIVNCKYISVFFHIREELHCKGGLFCAKDLKFTLHEGKVP